MFQLLIVIGLVLVAGIYLFKKLHNTLTKPYDGCKNCSGCSSVDKCDVE